MRNNNLSKCLKVKFLRRNNNSNKKKVYKIRMNNFKK